MSSDYFQAPPISHEHHQDYDESLPFDHSHNSVVDTFDQGYGFQEPLDEQEIIGGSVYTPMDGGTAGDGGGIHVFGSTSW